MRRLMSRLIADKRGATVIEYGLICALVFMVAVGSITAFGNNASKLFITAGDAIDGALK